MKPMSRSAKFLTVGGVILAGLGLYFVFLRPPLLPEDPRFMGATLAQIKAVLPGLPLWLTRVFWVMGGYMFAAGVLTCYLATTAYRTRAPGAAVVAAISGASSIGLMVVVNFMIESDFKWLLLAFALPWFISLLLYRQERLSGGEKSHELRSTP